VDSKGVHLIYYRRNADNTLDVFLQNSRASGPGWDTLRVTSQSFPGAITVPNFDPWADTGYMGDYIANVSDGSRQCFAWGDNRDKVTNFLWRKHPRIAARVRSSPSALRRRRGQNVCHPQPVGLRASAKGRRIPETC
jgi:hypothetical protein